MMAFFFKLPFKLAVLLIAGVAAATLWNQATLSVLALTRIDPLPETRSLIAEERYAEAADYLGFFMTYDYVGNSPEAQILYQQIEESRSQWRYQLGKLSEGLLRGSSDETIGQIASVATDFMVIGDIRDLANQGVNLAQGEDVDEVMVALASLGVLATGAQVASGVGTAASGGAAAPAVAGTTVTKSSLITLKTARRLGQLPGWLGRSMVTAARQARETRRLGQLKTLFRDINVLASTRGGMRMLAKTQDAVELRRAARFAETFGHQSASLYRVGGQVAMDVAQGAGRLGKGTILLAATFGQKGLVALDKVGALRFTKLISRGGKMVYKGDVLTLIAKMLLALPKWWLYSVIALAIWLWMPRRLMSVLWKPFRQRHISTS
ncbi:hypothetical protein [Vreelandella azerica]|nr:hypothetical protein [Halomonas azerica]